MEAVIQRRAWDEHRYRFALPKRLAHGLEPRVAKDHLFIPGDREMANTEQRDRARACHPAVTKLTDRTWIAAASAGVSTPRQRHSPGSARSRRPSAQIAQIEPSGAA